MHVKVSQPMQSRGLPYISVHGDKDQCVIYTFWQSAELDAVLRLMNSFTG